MTQPDLTSTTLTLPELNIIYTLSSDNCRVSVSTMVYYYLPVRYGKYFRRFRADTKESEERVRSSGQEPISVVFRGD